uniref:NRX2A protein n=1 Tax=Junco hyemalis TaxID=40217 RepID=A0A8C5IE88_JUNHY
MGTTTKGRCLGTECHQPLVPTWATPAPCPRAQIPSGARLGLVLLTLGSLLLPCARASALEFGGAPGQWARYGRWAPGAGGQLSFRFKTNVTRALLLYLDDGGNCDFLELLVAEGRLRLRFAIACAEPATLEPPAPVSDGRWHAVLLTRQARHAALAVDGEARAAAVRSKRPDMAVASDLFVGGIPPDVRLSALTLSTVKYEPPFRGWVADLRVGDAPAALLGAQGVRGDGDERCAHHPPCAHGGRCTLRRGEPRCDCAGTGHRGPFCEEGEGAARKEGRVGAGAARGSRVSPWRWVSPCLGVIVSLRVSPSPWCCVVTFCCHLLASLRGVSIFMAVFLCVTMSSCPPSRRWVPLCFSIHGFGGPCASLCPLGLARPCVIVCSTSPVLVSSTSPVLVSSCPPHPRVLLALGLGRSLSLHDFPVSSRHFVLELLHGFVSSWGLLCVLVSFLSWWHWTHPRCLIGHCHGVLVAQCPRVTVSSWHGVLVSWCPHVMVLPCSSPSWGSVSLLCPPGVVSLSCSMSSCPPRVTHPRVPQCPRVLLVSHVPLSSCPCVTPCPFTPLPMCFSRSSCPCVTHPRVLLVSPIPRCPHVLLPFLMSCCLSMIALEMLQIHT